MKNGKMVLDGREDATQAKPSRIIKIKSPDIAVFSISDGEIETIDSVQDGSITIYISNNEYTIIYKNLKKFFFKVGDLLNKNQQIGEIDVGGRLELIVIKDGIIVEPVKLIGCRIIYER